MKKRMLAISMVAVVTLLTGCGNSHSADKQQVQQNVNSYIHDFSTKNFKELLPLLSGDALSSVQQQLANLKDTSVQNTVKNVKVSHIDFPDNDHAMAEAKYLLTQTISGYGTTEDDYTVEFYLRKIDGTWKVYASQTEIDAPATGSNA